jgi:hypothetical protein
VRISTIIIAAIVIAGVSHGVNAENDERLLVICSPGSPGTTDRAQPRMDAFAAAVAAKAGQPLGAVYEPTDAEGVKRFASASLGIVSLPFFLARENELGLHAQLEAVQQGRPTLEHWTLVVQKGRVAKAEALAGMTIVSNAGFDPAFVRAAIAQLGPVPAGAEIVQSSAVLPALRRAANGEPVAVLLDGPQTASLGSLPFASKLETVTTSPAWPAGIVVTVGTKISSKAWAPFERALLGLGGEPAGAAARSALEVDHFAPLDRAALASARTSFTTAR